MTCTDDMLLNIGLDAGTTTGATTSQRLLTDDSDTLNYNLYTDSDHTDVWGNTAGTDTVDVDVDVGTEQKETIYGLVPSGQTATPDDYSDKITVTVTYADQS